VLSRNASASAVSASSTQLSTSTTLYQAQFNPVDWTGELKAISLLTGGLIGPVQWSTNGKVPSESARNLFTYNPTLSPVGSRGVNLAWANLSPAQQLALRAPTEVTDVNAQKRLTWLRGGRTDEKPSGFLRQRADVFGDIVNADPVYSGAQDFRYDLMPTSVPGQSTYGSFVLAKATRTPTVFIGANDGFTHAINATSGVEMFAYMPSSVFANAVALTTPGYGTVSNPHQYYVSAVAGTPFLWVVRVVAENRFLLSM